MPSTQRSRSPKGFTLTRIRDLPGFTALEDTALLYGGQQLEDAADLFTKRHFGIGLQDLHDFRPDDEPSIDYSQLDRELQNHPDLLLSDYLTDDEIVELLEKLGFDLRSERGQPLRSTKSIALPIEAAARGFAGRIPDPATIEVEKFEAKIAAEAAAYQAKKRLNRD